MGFIYIGNDKEDLVAVLAYISGLTSASDEIADKSFEILKSFPSKNENFFC